MALRWQARSQSILGVAPQHSLCKIRLSSSFGDHAGIPLKMEVVFNTASACLPHDLRPETLT